MWEAVGVMDIDKKLYYAYPSPIIPATPAICPYTIPFCFATMFLEEVYGFEGD